MDDGDDDGDFIAGLLIGMLWTDWPPHTRPWVLLAEVLLIAAIVAVVWWVW